MLQLQQQLSSGNQVGFADGFDNEGNSFGFLNQGGGGLNSLEIGGAGGSQQSTTSGFNAAGIGRPSGSQQPATGGFNAAEIGGGIQSSTNHHQPVSGSYNSFVKENEKIKESVEQQEISDTPINTLPIPVLGSHSIATFDGCGDSSIRMTADGKCHPLLRQGPCSNPRFWLTIDPKSLKVRVFFLLN